MQTKHFPRLILAILMVFTISTVIGQAQEENLLTNPGFEDGFSSSGVASDWESWVSSDADAPGFQEAPDYIQASDASDNGLIPQVRSGNEAQAMFSFFATHDAGIYQQTLCTLLHCPQRTPHQSIHVELCANRHKRSRLILGSFALLRIRQLGSHGQRHHLQDTEQLN